MPSDIILGLPGELYSLRAIHVNMHSGRVNCLMLMPEDSGEATCMKGRIRTKRG